MHGCQNAWVSKCMGVKMHGYQNAWVSKCMGVKMHGCQIAHVYGFKIPNSLSISAAYFAYMPVRCLFRRDKISYHHNNIR